MSSNTPATINIQPRLPGVKIYKMRRWRSSAP